MSNEKNILFTPFSIGRETIKNRFVMGPMSLHQLDDSDGALNDSGIEYFTERAKGGFGLIFTGTMMTDMEVDPYDSKTVSNPLFAPVRFMNRASLMNDRCGAYGTKVIAELSFGAGRNYPTLKAPSAVEVFEYPQINSIEITKDEIHKKQEYMIRASAVVKAGGFAGVDIHALHWGYFLDQFLMPLTNKREDEYGGSLENRMRVLTETVQGIHQVCGGDFPVTVGLSVKSYVKALNKASLTGEDEAGRTIEESVEIAKMLERIGIAAILVDVGMYDSYYYACPPGYMPKGHGLKLYAEITKNVGIPVIGRSRMGDPALCEEAVRSGQVDAVAMARPALADPYFPRKIEMGIPEKIRPCIGCNIGCMGNMLEKGIYASCAVNPRAGREAITRPRKAVSPRRIAVVGGGVAGMQAALTATECGHDAELFEKSAVLGGEMNAAGAHSFKAGVLELRDWFIRELKEKRVPIHLMTEVDADEVKTRGFDTVILATGASSVMPDSVLGIEKAVSAVELLEGKVQPGEKVIVVGGGLVGCETAADLAEKGHAVTLIEALPNILSVKFVPRQHKMMLTDILEYLKVKIVTGKKLAKVTDAGVIVEPADGTGGEEFLEANTTVVAIGLKPNKSLAADYYGKNIAVYEIGSAQKAGDIITAIHDAFEVAYCFD